MLFGEELDTYFCWDTPIYWDIGKTQHIFSNWQHPTHPISHIPKWASSEFSTKKCYSRKLLDTYLCWDTPLFWDRRNYRCIDSSNRFYLPHFQIILTKISPKKCYSRKEVFQKKSHISTPKKHTPHTLFRAFFIGKNGIKILKTEIMLSLQPTTK